MLILKKPIELNSLKPLKTSWPLFGEKIAANYRFLLTDIQAEDLLHMAVTPPESDAEEDSNNLLTVNFSPNYTNQLRSEMMNSWFNRILLIGTQNFTYQDEVYVTQLMQKMGITQTAEFINLVHKLYQTDKTVANLIKNYCVIGQEFRKAVQNISHVSAWTQEEQATQLTARYFLQEDIYKHLATAELTRTVYEYHKGVQGTYHELASEDILLAEHLKMADMIQIAQLKSENASGVYPLTLLYSDYSEQNKICQGEITEKKILTQIVSTVLLYVTDMIHRNLQSNVMTGQQQKPQLLRQCLPAVYHSLPAILVRAREQNRQKKWQQDGAYPNFSKQQIRDSSKQLYEYEEQLTTLFAKQYREAAMTPGQAAEQLAYTILQTQNVEQQLAEYYNCIQAGGYAFDQEQLIGHKNFNNEIISNLQKKAYYLENSATMQMTFVDNGENIQFSSNADSQMTFIRLQVRQIEIEQSTLFKKSIKKYLLRDESIIRKQGAVYEGNHPEPAMPDKDTALGLTTVHEDAGLGFVTKSEENHQDADIVYEGKLAEMTAEHEARHPQPVTTQERKEIGTASENDGKPEGTTIQYVSRNDESAAEIEGKSPEETTIRNIGRYAESASEYAVEPAGTATVYADKNAEPESEFAEAASVNEEKHSGSTIIYKSKNVEIFRGDEWKLTEYVAGDEKKQTDNVTGYDSNHTEAVTENKRKITVSEIENESVQIWTAKEYKTKTAESVTEYEEWFTEALTEDVHKSTEDKTEYVHKRADDMAEYAHNSEEDKKEYVHKSVGKKTEDANKSVGQKTEDVHKSAEESAEYASKSVGDKTEYVHKSVEEKIEYVHKSVEDKTEYGGKSAEDKTEYVYKSVEDKTEYGGKNAEDKTEYVYKNVNDMVKYGGKSVEDKTEYVHKSVEDKTEYGGNQSAEDKTEYVYKNVNDIVKYGGKSVEEKTEYVHKSVEDKTEYGGKSVEEKTEYVHKSVENKTEYGGNQSAEDKTEYVYKNVNDMVKYGGKSVEEKTEYVHKSVEDKTEYGGKSDLYMAEYSRKKVEDVTEYGSKTIEPVAVQEEKLKEPMTEYKWKQAELVTGLENKNTEPDTVYRSLEPKPYTVPGVTVLEQGELIEYHATLQPTTDQSDWREQSILYEKVIQNQLNLYQTNTLVNRPSDNAATKESKENVNSEKTDSKEQKQAIQIQQDIQMKQFLDSVNEQNIKKQQAMQNQMTINEAVLQVRIDREAAKKNAVEMLENPQEVLSKMIEHSNTVNRKETEQILSNQEIKKETARTQFPERSQETELQAAIHKIDLQNETSKFHDTDFKSCPEPDRIVSLADELQLIYKQNYRETEEEREMYLQQKKMISEEQVKKIEKNLENYISGNITQKLTHTAMTELREEIKITGEMMIPNLIQQNMQTQVASISERVYRRLERRLIEERQRRGY